MASKGQAVVNQIERYINRYVSFPEWLPGQSLVLALWAIHTWLFDRFPATPYLSIQAVTPEAGKTSAIEAMALICQNAEIDATMRPLGMLRTIRDYGGHCTIGVDEAEKLSSAQIGDLRSIFTSGAYPGGRHTITVKLTERMSFDTFCPKMFALIGDVVDVVKSRAIICWLVRAEPQAQFRIEKLTTQAPQRMANEIVQDLKAYLKTCESVPVVVPVHLKGREAEIWCAIYSVASLMALDEPTMGRLMSLTQDMIDHKHQAHTLVSVEGDKEKENAVQVLRDLASVLPAASKTVTGDVHSVEALRLLKLIPTSPWRTFGGEGLSADTLAGLLKRFGVTPEEVRMERGRGGKLLKGYKGDKVRAAVAKYLAGGA